MVMIILGNYKNNYDIATKTAQWALTPKQLNLVFAIIGKKKIELKAHEKVLIPLVEIIGYISWLFLLEKFKNSKLGFYCQNCFVKAE